MTEIHVKNMVCARCVKAVRNIFQDAGINDPVVTLGMVKLDQHISEQQENEIRAKLDAEGFEWLDDLKVKLVEKIKQLIVDLVHYGELDDMKENLSTWLSTRLNKEYHYLSNAFSTVENTTVEQYFILQKIEKVKEWLVYGELTLNEMAFRLGYSSVAHLSTQFKKVTGFTPTQFKQLKEHHRKPIDRL